MSLAELSEDGGIFDFVVLRKEQDFGDDFGGFRIVVCEGKEEATAVLGVDRNDAECSAWLAMHGAAAEVDVVVAEGSVNEGVLSVQANVDDLEQ